MYSKIGICRDRPGYETAPPVGSAPSEARRRSEVSTSPVAQSTTAAPTFSLAILRGVLAELEPQYGQRAVRAATIVAIRAIEQSPESGLWWVPSECDVD